MKRSRTGKKKASDLLPEFFCRRLINATETEVKDRGKLPLKQSVRSLVNAPKEIDSALILKITVPEQNPHKVTR